MDRSEKIPDTCLIKSSAKGNKQAFGLLYQRYLNEIYRFVFYKVGNIEIAEDITEDTFVRTWERLISSHDNKWSIKNLRAWLYQTANNLVIDHYRKRKPVQLIEKFTHSKKASPEEIIELKDMSQVLMETIRALKPEFQQIIILRFINELSHEETASIMRISTAYSRVLQYRALKKLKADLTKKVGRYVE
jgi:RNA polymerase sigma-70 factor, ECF subfamily